MHTVSGRRSALARLTNGWDLSPRPCSSRRTFAGGEGDDEEADEAFGGGMMVTNGEIAGGKSD